MASTHPENGSPPPPEPDPELTELLVIYHQHLVDQSRLSRDAAAFETPAEEIHAASSIDDSLAEDPELASELARMEDCLWQLEQLRRVETPGLASDPSAAAAALNRSNAPAASAQLGEGRLGRFKIIRELGRGGLGVVFLAHDPVLNRHVALKIPRSESLLTPELHQRFQREAQAAARLTHPNIVPVYEVGQAGPIDYIASAYIAGETLAEWLNAQAAPVPTETAARIVAPLADAMHYAHTQGVLHRDLKPANVLLEPLPGDSPAGNDGGYALAAGKIADFGLAKLLDLAGNDTRAGAIVGTPAYMSPEQAEGKQSQLTPATDIYSLGVILYELLLGRPPFRGESDAATLVQVVQGEPSALRKARADIPADLEAICLKCLERAPADRYRSAGELAADLGRFLAGEATLARPLSIPQRAGRWMRRNPILATLSALSLLLLVGVAVISTVSAVQIRSARDEARRIAVAERAARARADSALLAEQTARRQAEAAEKQTAEARMAADQQAANATQVSNMLLELFTTADPLGMARLGFRSPDEVGMDLPLSELLSRGARHARDTLADQPLLQATLLDTLGKVYSNLGQFSDADPLVREAYELRQNNGASEAELTTSKLHVGNLLRLQGHHAEAEALLRDVLATRIRLLGADDLGVAEARFALAWLLSERAMLKQTDLHDSELESSLLIEQALGTQMKVLGPDHRDVGLTMSAAALGRWHRGDVEGAKQLLLDATSILLQQEGGERLLLAMAEVARGTMARNKRDFDTAIDCYRSSLPAVRELLGEKHISTMMLMGELAGTLRDSGQMAEGVIVIREAIRLGFEMFPEGHPTMLEGLRELADIAESCGDYAEAEALERQASEVELRWMGTHSGRESEKILCLRINSGRYAEALEILNSRDAPRRHNLRDKAAIANALGQHRTAEGILCAMLNNAERYELYTDEWELFYLNMARVVHADRPEDPEKLDVLQRIWDPKKIQYAPQHPQYCHLNLATSRILIDQKRHDEVAAVVETTLDFLRTKTMPGNWCIGYAESVAGQLRNAQGKIDEAEDLLLSGLANLRKSRGEHHPVTREAAGALIKFYQQQGRGEEAVPYEPLLELPEQIEIEYELLAP